MGISTEKLPYIFDRFYQVDGEAMEHMGGTGIGLALTKELIDLLGGTITVQSEVGEGTEFNILLPISRMAELEAASDKTTLQEAAESFISTIAADIALANAPEGQEDKPLLLLVDDNRDVIAYLQACLQRDYRLVFAANGEEGIKQAQELIPDLVVSDVMMPKKSGLEFTNDLKNHFLTSHIPIILLTAKADFDSKLEGLSQGADAYLTKPFRPEELHLRIRKLIELRQKLQARYQKFSPPTIPVAVDQSMEDEFIHRIKDVLLENLSDEDFGITQLCFKVGISRAQLHRKLKALTGKSASHFIRSYRLHRANELLQTTHLNVSEVAYEVGYRNLSYFSKTFLEEFGVSPGERKI